MEAATDDYITINTPREDDKRGCIRTFTGLYVNPLQLRPVDIRIEDIAHHLANICRYTGACPKFYSVAQHSVCVSSLMFEKYGTAEAAMAGRLHDAAETYFNDIASPVKRDPRMKWYRDLEHEATLMIFDIYGVAGKWLPLTKEFDDQMFRDEAESWWGMEERVVPVSPEKAEEMFLRGFRMLQKDMSR